jgi:hypothetical protein
VWRAREVAFVVFGMRKYQLRDPRKFPIVCAAAILGCVHMKLSPSIILVNARVANVTEFITLYTHLGGDYFD